MRPVEVVSVEVALSAAATLEAVTLSTEADLEPPAGAVPK